MKRLLVIMLLVFISTLVHAQCDFTGGGTYGPNNWPPAGCSPYASNSPFNLRVPANPQLSSDSAAVVARTVSEAPGGQQQFILFFGYSVAGLSSTHDCNHAWYFSSASDPVYSGGPSACPGPIHIPNVSRPGQGCSDHHIAIIDKTTNLEYDFYQFPIGGVSGGGTVPHSSACGNMNINTGQGTGIHVTAAYFSELAGMIRGNELKNGAINHALFVVTSCDNGKKVFPGDVGISYVNSYPCASPTGAPAVGARFWLDYTDAQIAALSIPTWEKTIVTALAHYGAYVGDQGGPNDRIILEMEVESGEGYAVYGASQPIQQVAIQAGLGGSGATSYQFAMPGIDWQHHLHVLDPCTAQGTCGVIPPPTPPPPTPSGQVTADKSVINFPNTLVGNTATAIDVTLTNSNTSTVNITSITASTNFAETTTGGSGCGSSIAAGASCLIHVTATPPSSGDFTGTLTVVVAQSPNGTLTTTLNVTGFTPTAPVAPTNVTVTVK